ncbi:phage holin family protein [Frigoribacterium sp. NBH87]|nr:phage holin family protein [Frigoribacterium sp. NBH87]
MERHARQTDLRRRSSTRVRAGRARRARPLRPDRRQDVEGVAQPRRAAPGRQGGGLRGREGRRRRRRGRRGGQVPRHARLRRREEEEVTDSTRSAGVRHGGKASKRSFFALVQDVPTLVTDLVKGELALLKYEVIGTLKAFGIGAGFLVGALVFVFAMLGVLLTGIVLLIAIWLPGWLSALIVAFVLLLVAALLAFLGYKSIKKGLPAVPEKTIASLKRDLKAIKGVGSIPRADLTDR